MSFRMIKKNSISVILRFLVQIFYSKHKEKFEKIWCWYLSRYSKWSKVYRVYNKRTLVVEESMHVIFDKSNNFSMEKVLIVDDAGIKKEDKDQQYEKSTTEK